MTTILMILTAINGVMLAAAATIILARNYRTHQTIQRRLLASVRR